MVMVVAHDQKDFDNYEYLTHVTIFDVTILLVYVSAISKSTVFYLMNI